MPGTTSPGGIDRKISTAWWIGAKWKQQKKKNKPAEFPESMCQNMGRPAKTSKNEPLTCGTMFSNQQVFALEKVSCSSKHHKAFNSKSYHSNLFVKWWLQSWSVISSSWMPWWASPSRVARGFRKSSPQQSAWLGTSFIGLPLGLSKIEVLQILCGSSLLDVKASPRIGRLVQLGCRSSQQDLPLPIACFRANLSRLR